MSQEGNLTDLEALADRARLSVIPLFAAISRTRFASVGSAVLLQSSNGRVFVVTAGHVLDSVSPDPLLTWGTESSGAIRLSYGRAVASEPRAERRHGGAIDLAAFPIDIATAEKLAGTGATFVSESRLDDDVDANALYAFVGYPHSANKPTRAGSANDRRLTMLPNTAVFAPAHPAELASYVSIGADPYVKFVAHFDHLSDRRHDDLQRPLPHPSGMSGGAVYCLGQSLDFHGLHPLRLVGIGTGYHSQARLFIAARSRAVRHLLTRVETRGRTR